MINKTAKKLKFELSTRSLVSYKKKVVFRFIFISNFSVAPWKYWVYHLFFRGSFTTRCYHPLIVVKHGLCDGCAFRPWCGFFEEVDFSTYSYTYSIKKENYICFDLFSVSWTHYNKFWHSFLHKGVIIIYGMGG